MQERNVISGTVAMFFSPFIEDYKSLLIWLVVAVVLILVDLRFGVSAAKKRGEKIRSSRIFRRTINKFVDYICWVSIACVLGHSFGDIFGIPILAAVIMLVVCSIELSSIFDNYFELKGLKKKLNIWKFVSKLFKLPEIEESLEDTDNESNK